MVNLQNNVQTSVIITCHDYGKYLRQSIESVLAQSVKPKEIIVINDASTDNTEKVALSFRDKIKYFCVDFKNAQKTRNFGLKKAKGGHIVYLDADDYLQRDFIQKMQAEMEKDPDLLLVYSDRFHIGDKDLLDKMGIKNLWQTREFNYNELTQGNYISLTSLIRKKRFKGFDEKINRFQDWDAWLAFLRNGKAKRIPLPLFTVRFHGNNKTLTVEALPERIKILSRQGLYNVLEKDFKQQSSEIANLKSVLLQKEQEINNLNNVIQQKENNFTVLRKAIQEKNQKISGLQNIVQQKDQGIGNLNEVVQQKNQEVDNLNINIQQKDQEIANFNQAIQEKDKVILTLNQAVQQKDQEISFMKSSKFWRLRNDYINIKNKFVFLFFSPNKFFKKYCSKIKYLMHSFKESNKREDFKNAAKRAINFIIYGKGVLSKKELLQRRKLSTENTNNLKKNLLGKIGSEFLNSGEDCIIIISHDASKTGAPFVALNIAKTLKEDLGKKVISILIQGGPLEKDFEKYGYVINLSHKSLSLMTSEEREMADDLFRHLSDLGVKKCICNTVLSGNLMPILKKYAYSCINLIHEQSKTICDHGFVEVTEKVLQFADKIVFSSKFVKDDFQRDFPPPKGKIFIRPQGIFLNNLFKDQKEVAARILKEKLKLKEDARIIFGCGFAQLRKGVDIFFEIANQISKDKTTSKCYFLWMGEWEDSLKEKLLKKANEEGFSNRIILNGFEDNPSLFFAGSDIFLLPSRQDPFPSVVLNAMDCGTPVIAFDKSGGAPEILANGQGVVVPYLDVSAMKNSILKLLNNEHQYKDISEKSKNAVREKFSYENYVKFLLEQLSDKTRNFRTPGLDSKNLRVSVVIPNYNYAKYLPERIESVIKQTYKPFEIIFLDDNSKDNSIKVAEKLLAKTDIPYKIILNDTNQGCFKQWAKGIREAKGDLVWIAEADDYCKSEFLETLIPKFNDPEVGLAYTQSVKTDASGKKGDTYLSYLESISGAGDRWRKDYVNLGVNEICDYLVIKNTIVNASAVVMRRDLLLKLGDEIGGGFKQAGDWFTYIRVLQNSKVAFCASPLNYHRYHNNTIVSRFGNNTKEQAEQLISETFDVQRFIITNLTISRERLVLALETVKQISRNYLGRELDSFSEYADRMKIYNKSVDPLQKRILFFSTNDGWGGSEVACAKMAQSFALDGWAVALCMNQHNPRPALLNKIAAEDRVKFFERGARDYCKSTGTANFVINFDPDIIFISQGHVFESLEMMKWCEDKGFKYVNFIPLVTEYHLTTLDNKNIITENGILLQQARKIFLDNHNAKNVMRKIFSVSFNNFQVIRNGFDVPYHQKFTWNNANDFFKLAFLGRLEYLHKGLDMLLEVLAMQKWKKRPLKIMAYGNGPHEQLIKRALKKNNIKNFILCGYTNNLEQSIQKVHGVIFPSRMEGTPISLVDALLCHRMAIVTPVGGMPEMVIDGQNGFVAVSATVAGIEECLERAWQRRHEWKKLGKNAGRIVREMVPEFPNRQCVDAVKEILE